MKLLSRVPGKLIFRLSKREREALQATVGLRRQMPRSDRPLTGDSATTGELQTAQRDLDAALAEHRKELSDSIEAMFGDSERCATIKGGGCDLTLSFTDTELLLQALNEVRVGAWEKLGCPDFESGELPEPDEKNLPAYWALQLTDAFQGLVLTALTDTE